MSPIAKETINMIELLPETEQVLINEMVKRIFIAWDSDYTKVTPVEAEALEQAEKEIESGEIVSHNSINWN